MLCPHCCMFSRSRVPICPAARYINVTDVLCPHCSLHVQQEPCAYLPDSKIIYLQMLYPRCFLHIHQELWAYLSDNKMIYLQMCYILAVSCWPGAACLFAQQQEPVLVRAAQVQEGAELSALRLLGRRGQMRHLRPFQVNHVFFLVRSITFVEIHCHSGVGSIKLKIHILTLIFIQSVSFLV